jgi:hypothetical protein
MWIFAQRFGAFSYRLGENAMAKGVEILRGAPFMTTDLLAAALDAAYQGADAVDPAWALANPEKALAVLMVDPRPCPALDALIAGAPAADVALAA